jgi:CheY-like chemotaxis protein
MPFLFDRFRQADSSATRAHMGLGLGLAIVRHLVELHGGTISAESRGAGRGATFRARLPRSHEELHPAEAAAPLHHDLDGVRILVVDDDEQVRNYVSAVFRGNGANVSAVPSAADALTWLESHSADVVLTDLAMPTASGYELLRWIRTSTHERIRTVPVVAVSAFAMPDDRQRAEDHGFQAFIAKPVEPAELRTAVMKVVYDATVP